MDAAAVAQEAFKAWGPPVLIALILWIFLIKSEKREALKDTRIQLLENLLIEGYDERIAAADRIAEALNENSTALGNLTSEIRSRRR